MENDLLIRTGHQIKDIGRTLSWGAFGAFIANEGPETSLGKELNPDGYEWSQIIKTNTILADIYDMLAMINANIVALASGKKSQSPDLYPRPGQKSKKDDKRFGSGALPFDELKEWIEKRRANGRHD